MIGERVFGLRETDCLVDPTEHGEMNAIRRCTRVLREKGLTPSEIEEAWKDLSLYTVRTPIPPIPSIPYSLSPS